MTNLNRLAAVLAVVALLARSGLWVIDRKPIAIRENAANSIESLFAGFAPGEHAEWILETDRDELKPVHKHERLKLGSAVVAYSDRVIGVETAPTQDQDDQIDCSDSLMERSEHYTYPRWFDRIWSRGGSNIEYHVNPQWAGWTDG